MKSGKLTPQHQTHNSLPNTPDEDNKTTHEHIIPRNILKWSAFRITWNLRNERLNATHTTGFPDTADEDSKARELIKKQEILKSLLWGPELKLTLSRTLHHQQLSLQEAVTRAADWTRDTKFNHSTGCNGTLGSISVHHNSFTVVLRRCHKNILCINELRKKAVSGMSGWVLIGHVTPDLGFPRSLAGVVAVNHVACKAVSPELN